MERILQILKEHFGEYVSGEELAKISGISRTAVWKQINHLREAGFTIQSATRRGYRFAGSPSTLHPYEVKEGLATKIFGQTVEVHEEIDSTNIRAKFLANQGAPEGLIVIAERQTRGRGRMGRSWASEPGLGVWCSLILRPKVGTSELAAVTILTAVAMTRAVLETTGIQAEIKWPNDLLYHGAKLAGILAELNGEPDRVNYLIVGIGLNVNHLLQHFPEELADKATSLRIIAGHPWDRKAVLQSFLRQFEASYQLLGTEGRSQIIQYARQHSATLGKEIRINQGFGKVLYGKAVNLDEDGSLWMQQEPDGQMVRVYSGDIMETI